MTSEAIRKLLYAAAFAGAVSLGACATHQTPGQMLEATDTSALNLYGQIGGYLDQYEVRTGDKVGGEAIRVKAWDALQTVNSAYKNGQSLNLTALTGLLNQVKGL